MPDDLTAPGCPASHDAPQGPHALAAALENLRCATQPSKPLAQHSRALRGTPQPQRLPQEPAADGHAVRQAVAVNHARP